MAEPVLWQYNFSNFNEKARWALDFKRVPHVRRSLLPGSPRAMAFSLRGTLPVLDLDSERIVDSTRIIEALERRHPDPPLHPTDPEERRRALELEDFFDEEVGHELRRAAFWELRESPDYVVELLSTGQSPLKRRLFRRFMSLPGSMAYANRRYRINREDADEARAKLAVALDRIVAERGPDGYLVGSQFTVADLAAAALLFPLAWPDELQYPYPPPPADLGALEPLAKHPAIDWIREMYRRHRGSSAALEG